MTEKELKKLSRADLLEMLLDQSEELQRLREEHQKICETLEQQQTVMDCTGSITQAAQQLNDMFEAAEATAKQYLESLEALPRQMEEQAVSEQYRQMLEQARLECQRMEEETRQRCRQMLADAQGTPAPRRAKVRCWIRRYRRKIGRRGPCKRRKAYEEESQKAGPVR